MNTNLVMIVFWFFIVFYVIFSVFMSRKGTSIGQFYNMEGNASAWLVAGTYTATWVSALGMLGDTGMAYRTGPLSGIIVWGAFPGFVMSAFVGMKLRRFGQVTLGDFFGERYQSQGLRKLSSVVTIVGLGGYFISQLIGSAIVVEALMGIPFNIMIVVMTVVFVVIAVSSGSKSVTITDNIMLFLIAVCLAYIFSPILIKTAGLKAFVEYSREQPEWFKVNGLGYTYAWGTILGWQVLWCFGNVANPSAITRCYLAKDSRAWVQSLMLAMMITLSVVWLTHMAGASVWFFNRDITPDSGALVWAAKNMVNPVLGGVAVAGLFGACLSTASTQILTVALSITRDLYEKGNFKDKSEKTLLRVARVSIVAVGLLAMVLSLGNSKYIVNIGNFGASVFAVAFFPALFLGLFWKGMTREGAFASMITGFAIDILLHFGGVLSGASWGSAKYLPLGIHPAIWSFFAAMITAFAVSAATKTSPEMDAVFIKVNTKTGTVVRTSDQSMRRFIVALGIYAVVQTSLIIWFALKLG